MRVCLQVVTDVIVVESDGTDDPSVPEGFALVQEDIMKGQEGAGKAFVCTKSSPLSSAPSPPLVEIALVYGKPDLAPGDAKFTMSGGYETQELPESLNSAFGTKLYLCTKRQGAGHAYAEFVAAKAAAEAAAAIDAETGGGASSLADSYDMKDEILDTSLSPEQIRELEEQRAQEVRERAMQAENEAAEAQRVAFTNDLKARLERAKEREHELSVDNAQLNSKLVALLSSQNKRGQDGERKSDRDDVPNHEAEKQYNDSLNAIADADEKFKYMTQEYDRVAYDLQKRLDEKEAKASDISDSFREFKKEIALAAEHSRTGKTLSKKLVMKFEEEVRDGPLSPRPTNSAACPRCLPPALPL